MIELVIESNTNVWSGELSEWGIVCVGNCPSGELSVWGIVRVGNCPSGELSSGELSVFPGDISK